MQKNYTLETPCCSNTINLYSAKEPANENIKIAYLILCHCSPLHIARLVKKVTELNAHAFIHVDGNAELEPFINALNNHKRATFIKDRIKIFWGGFSSIEATIKLYKTALSYDNFDRFVILQGLEYPIKSNEEIHEFFKNNATKEFILAQNATLRNDCRSIHKFRLYHFLDKPKSLAFKLTNKLKHYCLKFNYIPPLKPKYARDNNGQKMSIYQGCAQIALTRNAVEYIVNFYDNNQKFNNYFKNSFASDESYFHTIIYNSKFSKNATGLINNDFPRLLDFRNLTYFDYDNNSVKINFYTKKHEFDHFKDSNYLFFRKVDERSNDLLDYIDAYHKTNKDK